MNKIVKMNRFTLAFGLAAAFFLVNNSANAEDSNSKITSKGWQIAGIRIANPFDSKTWWDGSEQKHGDTVTFNFADPEFWMSIPNPKSHSRIHGAITNPQTWAQFMKVETYSNMMDVNVWKKWLDVKSYDVLRDPQTYAYWMQPGAYMHLANVDHYAQIINPNAYTKMFEQGAKTVNLSEISNLGSSVVSMFNMKSKEHGTE